MKRAFAILSIAFIVFSFRSNRDIQVLDQLFNSIDTAMSSVNSLQFNLRREERIGGELIAVENYIRFQASPFKSMIQFLGDKEGDFLIFIPHENNGKAVFIPGGFPYVNVSLDPESYLMRRTSHYTVKEIGVQFIVDQIKGNYLKWKDNFHYRGIVHMDNKHYHKIEGILDELTYVDYLVQKDESLGDIGKKFYVSEYMLMEINDNVDDLDDDLEGEIIKIPTCYANHIVMFVNDETFFPEKILIEDEKGLFEKYEYKQVRINEPIDQRYFTEDFLEDL